MDERTLAEIEERAHKARTTIYPHVREAFFDDDFPALVKEVRRLQANVRDLDLKLEESKRGHDAIAKHHATCSGALMHALQERNDALAKLGEAQAEIAEMNAAKKERDLDAWGDNFDRGD
jgi:chromosome segregation ATPase